MKIERTNFQGEWDDICPYCGETQAAHKEILGENRGIRYEYRLPCEAEKQQHRKELVFRARAFRLFMFIGWILIPLIIVVVGFASVIVGAILFAISLFKIAWTGIEFYGKPTRWFPGYQSKMEKDRKMRHYYYHCERNPDGFSKLFVDNLKNEDDL